MISNVPLCVAMFIKGNHFGAASSSCRSVPHMLIVIEKVLCSYTAT